MICFMRTLATVVALLRIKRRIRGLVHADMACSNFSVFVFCQTLEFRKPERSSTAVMKSCQSVDDVSLSILSCTALSQFQNDLHSTDFSMTMLSFSANSNVSVRFS